jgi:hypothetical protein
LLEASHDGRKSSLPRAKILDTGIAFAVKRDYCVRSDAHWRILVSEGPLLLERLMRGVSDAELGVVANDLLGALFRGYAVSNLLTLLHSGQTEQVRTGAWLLSELGRRGSELRGELPALLHDVDHHVRFYAIDSALTCCTEEDGETLASVVRLLEDTHRGVRLKVADFLMRARLQQLNGALSAMEAAPRQEDGPTIAGLRWLLSTGSRDPTAVRRMLEDKSGVTRKFGVVAAVRTLNRGPDVMATALQSSDPDIAELARQGQDGI